MVPDVVKEHRAFETSETAHLVTQHYVLDDTTPLCDPDLKNADGHKYRQVLGMSKIFHFTCSYTVVVYTASCLHLSHHGFCCI